MGVDYALKSRILKTNCCKRVNAIDKATFLNTREGVVFDQELEYKYFDLVNEFGLETVKEARKINKATFYRYNRLRDRVSTMLDSGNCIWCTFTFDDDALKTSPDTRRQYVRRYLNAFNCPYIANIDYGHDNEYISRHKKVQKGTEREHYHALILIDKMPLTWSNGWCFYERVKTKDKEGNKLENVDRKIGKYISKLTNHAIKESTKGCRVIYSRMK